MKRWKLGLAALLLVWWFTEGPRLETLMVYGIPSLFTLIGAAAVFSAVTTYRRSQYIKDIPTSRIQSAATGLVEITGQVAVAEETITSPFAERECVLCQYGLRPDKEEDEDQGLMPEHGLAGVPFYVEDGTGRMLVRPNGADIRIPRDLFHLSELLGTDRADTDERVTVGKGFVDQPPVASFAQRRESWRKRYGLTDRLKNLRAFNQAAGSGADPRAIPEGPLEYVEARVEPGDTVYVLGTAQSEDPADEEAPDLVIAQSPQARRAASPAGSYFADLLNTENLFRMSGEYSSIFLISSEGEEAFVDTLRSRMWTNLIVGFLIFLIGLIALMVFVFHPTAY